MARPSQVQTLSVWMNGEQVGLWSQKKANGPETFTYVATWLRSASRRPISLSMPLGPEGTVYTGPTVSRFFDNLLSDSRSIRERLRQRFMARSTKAFDLLAEIGRDCVGAIQLLPEGEAPPDVRQISGRALDKKGVEQHLVNMVGTPLGRQVGDEDFRISLAGAQEKTALLRHNGKWMLPTGTTPSTHIFKLPIGTGGNGIDLTTSVENEWLCAQLLAAYQLPVAHCEMAVFGSQKVLVVQRFDRRLAADDSWIVRLPQEDLCQATGMAAEQKYEADGGPGIRKIMDVLLGSITAEADRLDFFRTQILFWMLCAIDGHAKNFSLHIEAAGSYRLTRRYDVLSAYPVLGKKAGQLPPNKVKMAMAVEGENRHYHWEQILYRHWLTTASRCGLGAHVETLITQLVEATPQVIVSVKKALPSSFPDAVATPIFQGLQRAATALERSRRG